MTIHLPKEVESSIEAAVRGGLFSSVDEAVEKAWVSFQRTHIVPQAKAAPSEPMPDLLLGSMRDYADEMDEIVAEAMEHRKEPWRVIDVE